jgi:hypothetical protein
MRETNKRKVTCFERLKQLISSDGPIFLHIAVAIAACFVPHVRSIFRLVFVFLTHLLCHNSIMYILLHRTVMISRCSSHPTVFWHSLCCALNCAFVCCRTVKCTTRAVTRVTYAYVVCLKSSVICTRKPTVLP